MPLLAALLALLAAAGAIAQEEDPPNGALLVAKPSMSDPRFARTVVLVTQRESGETAGVILNRPTQRTHAPSGEKLYYGGPVMQQVVVAVFRAPQRPEAPAFHVLRGVYLSMHPANVEKLPGSLRTYRLYSGFSGWAPAQLQAEMELDAWYILPASEDLVFREDTGGMWDELVEKARGRRTEAPSPDSRIIPRYAVAE
jgi:putative transcriptional regulator